LYNKEKGYKKIYLNLLPNQPISITHYFSIDYLIVYAFLAITLFIGLRTGRGVKDIRDYADANKMLGTGTLILTWLATDIAGGSVLGMT
jgi:Na+/proline symporter